MATNTKTQQDAASAPREAAAPSPLVKVRIIKHRTHAQGMIYAAGAIITMPKDTAETLVSLGAVRIVGV